jgi:hypothetical protein
LGEMDYERVAINILGALVGWLLWGGFTKNFEADSITILVIGILLGYIIEKKKGHLYIHVNL